MHFTRWWNPSLPQTLLYGVMLLYVNAVFSLTSLLGLGIGGSAYELTPVLYTGTYSSLDQVTTIQTVAVLAGTLAYGFAGSASPTARSSAGRWAWPSPPAASCSPPWRSCAA